MSAIDVYGFFKAILDFADPKMSPKLSSNASIYSGGRIYPVVAEKKFPDKIDKRL